LTPQNITLYSLAFLGACVLSLVLTPAARAAALFFHVIDHPNSDVKTHKEPVPYLGGVAIFLSFVLVLLWIRVLTSFPTGTLRSLRGIVIGGTLMFILGLIDDIKFKGLHYRTKFVFQITATLIVILFGIRLQFIHPVGVALILSLVWIVGVTNALNLIDIMDGLASGIVFIAALGFLFISLPTEEIYVNFAAAALAGAVLGFMPFNFSKKYKLFMGDCGSLFLGFVVAVLALGTSYKGKTNLAVLCPLLILAVPLYDTLAVFAFRIKRGMSPFLGSKDHFPLRLEKLGWSRTRILIFTLVVTLVFNIGAFVVTKAPYIYALAIYCVFGLCLVLFTLTILKAKVE